MRRLGPAALLLIALVAAGCAPVPPRPVQFPGKDYQAVLQATVAGICETRNFFVYHLDAEQGVVDVMMHSGGLGGHPRFQALVTKGGRAPFPAPTIGNARSPWIAAAATTPGGEAPTLMILMPGNWPFSQKLIDAIGARLTGPAAAQPAPAGAAPAPSSAAPSAPTPK